MRRGWKKVAEFADNQAATPADICSAMIPALSHDWHEDVPAEVSTCICEVLGDGQETLFGDQKVMQLEALHRTTAGRS